ncbi:AbrB/MazE/SpoVT family DNA-binding domain-containing protein [Geoalkalibacter sp.]|jgi:AbrB family looped-hinge helix DNA binding protein|uniref:AbrB/MazE/SpoVT family DNA-binding domain-containing protein n=1 Tax=Geoalkalibacter sp. TaxID=3041440 RepID=UPI00272DF382|nr:AbrB/MazE/SpoVT family DNA-binding domain-containing protein [Geoalkalibacter sp.]
MAITTKVTSKGQITLPKSVREALGSDVVEIRVEEGRVLLFPVKSQAGALRDYAREARSMSEIREEVWGEVVKDHER